MELSNYSVKNNDLRNTESVNYNLIDVFKFLCAFLVCMIHIQPFSVEGFEYAGYLNVIFQNYICRIAVPFYFTTSGFFLFRKMDINNFDSSLIKKYCLKLFWLFGLWSFILYSNNTGHLWYLKAVIVAVALVGFLLKYRIKFKYIVAITVVLYIIGLLGDSYYGIIESLNADNILRFSFEQYNYFFLKTRNGVFMGAIFVFIGVAFSQKKISIKIIPSILGLMVSMLLLLVEVYLVRNYLSSNGTNMYIFLVPTIIFLFNIILKIKIKDRKIYPRLRVISMLIYYSHLLVESFVRQVFLNIKNYFGFDCSRYFFITIIIVVVLLAVFIERISQKEKFKWLQHLYK